MDKNHCRVVDKTNPPKRVNGDDGHDASDSHEEGKENKKIEYNSPMTLNLDHHYQQNSNENYAVVAATVPESNKTQWAIN